MIAEKFEDVRADRLAGEAWFGFDGEKQIEDASGDEGDEESAIVDNDVLQAD